MLVPVPAATGTRTEAATERKRYGGTEPGGGGRKRYRNRAERARRQSGAHNLARIIRALIVSGQPYDEAKAFAITPASTARRLKNLQNQAHVLNLKLVSD